MLLAPATYWQLGSWDATEDFKAKRAFINAPGMLREASRPLVHRTTPMHVYLMQLLGIRHRGASESGESHLSELPALRLTLPSCKTVCDKSL